MSDIDPFFHVFSIDWTRFLMFLVDSYLYRFVVCIRWRVEFCDVFLIAAKCCQMLPGGAGMARRPTFPSPWGRSQSPRMALRWASAQHGAGCGRCGVARHKCCRFGWENHRRIGSCWCAARRTELAHPTIHSLTWQKDQNREHLWQRICSETLKWTYINHTRACI